MSAQDHLSQQLFHGTIENLPEGAHIKPREAGEYAWATPNLEDAQKHTIDRIASGLGHSSEGQHPHHGNIYEVEPITTSDGSSKDFPGAVKSRTGFIVKRQVASVLNPDEGARKHRDPVTNKPKPLR